ncbi:MULTISPECIES: conjugal transfer protein VirC2 [Agrobacterium]|uniref:Conjugal transfer protein VirC2 n=3 Tax=Agrobacterium tumefaciens complex TaxID=1183400 RepID=A0AAE6EIS0_AGRTU|nr:MULTISPECIES: conjugal transfer protein VirC2 [Agrobacterium]ASK40683.1 virulence protein [Agrobacterium genomosp. 6]ASK40897.1 virulence protein [Agrobacterium genomosp. 6]ASK41446.1 virulence protein [Agrobacterium genomosp. 6]QCL77513.1 conjugal transfer protein VirC2 [Agrobacterium tumefaciens]QCL83001.1 conjugal transfer protein VirC2 [Agrobacterium tumefaciens]
MAIHKPALSVGEARRLAGARPEIHHPNPTLVPQKLDLQHLPEKADEKDQQREPLVADHIYSPDRQLKLTVDALSPPPSPKKLQVFLSARPPAPQVSKTYDNLVRQYSPSKSLQMILRRALDDFESMLADGSFRVAPKSYPIPSTTEKSVLVQTSRMFPVALLEVARSHFDPLGLETARAFGHKLATAALASFFAGEKPSSNW